MQRRMHCRRPQKTHTTDFGGSVIFEQKDGPTGSGVRKDTAPARLPSARLVAVNHFETIATDTLVPLADTSAVPFTMGAATRADRTQGKVGE
ncbi:hypothetical protein GWE18_34395 [Bradyrhizobium sp. CSA112]|nr:hypothetical protein [Bradyrhizobium sp. CSA112]